MTRLTRLRLLLALAAPLPLVAQASGTGPDVLAEVIAAEDARNFDEPLLRRALLERDTAIRRAVYRSIGRLRDPRGLPLLKAALTEGDTLTEASGLFAVGLIGDTAGLPILTAHFRDRPQLSTSGARELMTAVARIGGPQAAGFLRSILQGSTGRTVPVEALERAALEAWRLGRLAPSEALLGLMSDDRESVRAAAAYSLGRLRVRAAAPTFLQVVGDKLAPVRLAAVRTLTKGYVDSTSLGADQVVGVLGRALSDNDPLIKIAALRSVATYRNPASVSRMLALLNDQNLNVQVQAAQSLGEVGGPAAVEALARILAEGKGTWARRAEALLALAKADTARFVAAEGPWGASRDWRERAVAARGWARVRRGELTRFLSDPDPRVVAAALEAYGGDGSGPPNLEYARVSAEHLGDRDPAVRATAAAGLASVGNPSDIPRLVAAFRAAARDSFPDAATAALGGITSILGANPGQAEGLERDAVASLPVPADPVVRRWAELNWPALAQQWGAAWPIRTGRTLDEYRNLVRTLVLGTEEQRYPKVRITMEALGSIELTLFGPDAPLTVANFLTLVDRRYFDGLRFHRVVPGFVVQAGDPRGDGWGGPATSIRDEINERRYGANTVGMALSGPDTGGSQWFVTLSPQPHLDGTYTIFGALTDGALTLHRLTQGDLIRSIRR